MKAKKYQNGGKAPEGKSSQERMYLEIRKDADRMKKEMQKKGMSEAEINKKLDAYMEKAMKQAQYSGKSMQSGGTVKKKKTTVNTDELGRKGSFNPYTKLTKGSRRSYSQVDSEYPEDYKNKVVGPTSRESGYAKKIGYQEQRMRGADRADKVMGLRAEAYKNRENKFGVKKPAAKVMKSGGKVVKYQEGGANPTPTGRTLTPDEIRITGTSENQGYSNPYAKVNKPVTAKDVLEKTEMSRLTEALRKQKYSTANLSLGDMRKIAKTKGLYDDARGLAREDYQKWLAKNRK